MLKIPWKNLYSEPVVAEVDGLYLLVRPNIGKYCLVGNNRTAMHTFAVYSAESYAMFTCWKPEGHFINN